MNVENQTKWFDEIVALLRSDEFQLETNTCSLDKKNFYDTIINKSDNEVFKMGIDNSSRHFITNMLRDYYLLIKEKGIKPVSISLNISTSGLLVWAVVKEDDYATEKALYLAEAKINANYHKYGFCIDTMAVENSENIPVPNHYKPFLANA